MKETRTEVQTKIIRLAEINAAGDMIALSDSIKEERQSIVNELKSINVIVLRGNGGFDFVENTNKNRELYLDCYNNF